MISIIKWLDHFVLILKMKNMISNLLFCWSFSEKCIGNLVEELETYRKTKMSKACLSAGLCCYESIDSSKGVVFNDKWVKFNGNKIIFYSVFFYCFSFLFEFYRLQPYTLAVFWPYLPRWQKWTKIWRSETIFGRFHIEAKCVYLQSWYNRW